MIKHFVFSPENKLRYICNQAVNPTPNKMTRIISKVTCKNCINTLMNKQLTITQYR